MTYVLTVQRPGSAPVVLENLSNAEACNYLENLSVLEEYDFTEVMYATNTGISFLWHCFVGVDVNVFDSQDFYTLASMGLLVPELSNV